MESVWTNAFILEMKVADIISRQAKHGTQFNKQKAQFYIHVLTERILNIDMELIPLLPAMMNKGTEYKKPFKLNGQFMKFPGEYAERVGLPREEVGGPFTAVWYTPFDPSKSAKVKDVMLDMGWIPTEWNTKKIPFQIFKYRKKLQTMSYAKFVNSVMDDEREAFETLINEYIATHFINKSKNYMKALLIGLGFDLKKSVPNFDQIKKKLLLTQFWPSTPKITDDSFESLDDEDSYALGLLKTRMVWSHRRSLIQGLLDVLRPDGKISGEANPCATPTARMKHKKIVNIPAGRSPLGKVLRSLFRGNYNGTSEPHLVRKLTQAMVDSGQYRRKPGTNIMQELKKDKWKDAGYCNLLIPRGFDAFVGGDGAGLELRMLTHYLIHVCKTLLDQAKEAGDESDIAKYESALKSAYDYREVLLNGDIHSHNQHLAGLPTRDAAKTFILNC